MANCFRKFFGAPMRHLFTNSATRTTLARGTGRDSRPRPLQKGCGAISVSNNYTGDHFGGQRTESYREKRKEVERERKRK